jgi:hypothetical protein
MVRITTVRERFKQCGVIREDSLKKEREKEDNEGHEWRQ